MTEIDLFGYNLKFLRKKSDLNQSQLADIVGISNALISDYERGRSQPKFSTVVRISEFFQVSVDDLYKSDLEKGKVLKDYQEKIFLEKGKVKGKVSGKVLPKNDSSNLNQLQEPQSTYETADRRELVQALHTIIDLLERDNERLRADLADCNRKLSNSS